ncbi:MAG: STAS domain-containing protein [Ancalomicrobiaceae bacterium]|nr:STAS domain-containing protein [Ancalomicrobiaceae bacterium]
MGQQGGSETIVALPEILDLNCASALKASLMEHVDASTDVTIDCSKVERIATPAIQVILAFAKSIGMHDHTLRLRSPTETFRNAFEDLGLHDQLTKWSAT